MNGDGRLDIADVDALVGLIVGGQYGEFEDLNRDGAIDQADLDIMILDIIHTVYGDANLNGTVDISDANIWNSSRFVQATRWSHADFNADGVVDVSDFLIWQANKFTASAYIHTEVTTHQFGFTGRMFDTATGLQNNLNRRYDPAAGRWISEDPFGFAGGDSNLYRYVGNSPTNATDPTGLWSFYRWLYTGDGNASDEVYDASLTAAWQALPRIGFNSNANVGSGGAGGTGGATLFGEQLIWNWGTFEFEEFAYIGGYGGIGTPGPTVNWDLGVFLVYDLPWDESENYGGPFIETNVGAIGPHWVGGYCNYAQTPNGDGPWSIGGGISIGVPGVTVTEGGTVYVQQ